MPTYKTLVTLEAARTYLEARSVWVPPSTCRIWERSCDTGGYGCAWYRSRALPASKLAYLAFKGPITKGMQVLHTCDTPSCVNPDHLFLGTHADNMADKAAKGRAPSVRSHAKLSDDQIAWIRNELATGRNQSSIAREIGVTPQNISLIALNKSWKVTPDAHV